MGKYINLPVAPLKSYKEEVNYLDDTRYLRKIESINGKDQLRGLGKAERIHCICEIFNKYDIKDEEMKKFLISYQEKIQLFNNLEGFSVGIIIDEEMERCYVYNNIPFSREYFVYYGITRLDLTNMERSEKLIWLFNNCQYIPVMIKREEIDYPNNEKSYKYSHIIRDEKIKKYILANHLSTIDKQPNINAFYFIHQNSSGYYLARDRSRDGEIRTRNSNTNRYTERRL